MWNVYIRCRRRRRDLRRRCRSAARASTTRSTTRRTAFASSGSRTRTATTSRSGSRYDRRLPPSGERGGAGRARQGRVPEGRQLRVRGAAHSVSHAIYTDPVRARPRRASRRRRPTGNINVMLDRYRGWRSSTRGASSSRPSGHPPRRGPRAIRPGPRRSDEPARAAREAEGLDARRHRRHHPPDRQRLHRRPGRPAARCSSRPTATSRASG